MIFPRRGRARVLIMSLLLGCGAGTASAQTLISNLGQTSSSSEALTGFDHAQAFTT